MSLSGEDLTKINGPDAVAQLEHVRSQREETDAKRQEEIGSGLAQVASKEGVVAPDDSLEVHSGQVPAVTAELPADIYNYSDLAENVQSAKELSDHTITDGWDATPRSSEVPSPEEYDRRNGIERTGKPPVVEGHQVNRAE